MYAPTDSIRLYAISRSEVCILCGNARSVDIVPRGNTLIVMGDLGRVGRVVGMWKRVIRKHGEDVENVSGRWLLRFSAQNDMQVMHTHFHHKLIRKCACRCPDREVQSSVAEPKARQVFEMHCCPPLVCMYVCMYLVSDLPKNSRPKIRR